MRLPSYVVTQVVAAKAAFPIAVQALCKNLINFFIISTWDGQLGIIASLCSSLQLQWQVNALCGPPAAVAFPSCLSSTALGCQHSSLPATSVLQSLTAVHFNICRIIFNRSNKHLK